MRGGEDRLDRHGLIRTLFGVPRALVGMIHVEALPGTPHQRLGLEELAAQAAAEAATYRDAGYHALVIENMHDRPYLKGRVGPEIVAAMTVVGREVRRAVSLPLGVQILAGANLEAIAVAHAVGAAFVRVEGFVFAHVADEGLMDSCAAELMRFRHTIGADSIRVFADIKKKHSSHAITGDLDLPQTARAAEFSLADGVIVTGAATGEPADPREVEAVREAVAIPTIVGSGITPENVGRFAAADALIVGSAVKRGGLWSNVLDPTRVRAMSRAFEAASTV